MPERQILPGIKVLNTSSGIVVEYGEKRIALDPVRKFKADYVFISHAHSDHLPPSVGDAKVIASEETVRLATERGLKITNYSDSFKNAELIDTGHILGSRGFYLDRTLLYTGDLAGRARGFMPAPKRVSCETLIIESTYGRQQYRFPPLASVLRSANSVVSAAIEAGKAVAIEGYPLGKSQVLTYLFQSWSPLYVYGSVARYNRIYTSFGVDLPLNVHTMSSADELSTLARRAGIAIFPTTAIKGEVRERLAKMNIPILRFTGWAINPASRYANNSTMFPVSDHADYYELISYAQSCRPDLVLTCHGYSADLAASLRRVGIRAKTISERQLSITEYLE
ncbi:MAG: MBL fold metallo-hydrolase [Conexivisphaerales archaeon]